MDSHSTGRTTLIGSDGGPTSPLSDDGKHRWSTYNDDRKSWVAFSPEQMEFLLRNSPLAHTQKHDKSSRFRALFRKTKQGIDLRFRRALTGGRDEITDIRIEAKNSPLEGQWLSSADEKSNVLPELEAVDRSFCEAPDTPIRHELPTVEDARPREGTLLPGYATYDPYAKADVNLMNINPVELEDKPLRGHLEDQDAAEHDLQTSQSSSHSGATGATLPSTEEEKSHIAASPIEQSQNVSSSFSRDDFQALLSALKAELSKSSDKQQPPADSTPATSDSLGELKVVETARYETETDVEPPSPSSRWVKAGTERRAAPMLHKRKRQTDPAGKSKLSMPKKLNRNSQKSSEVDLESIRRRTSVPRRLSRDDDPEIVWSVLLKTQSQILGPEHPLIWQAKHAQSLSRVERHNQCDPSLLAALDQSKAVAVQTLGAHPLVETFSYNLATLKALILKKTEDSKSPKEPERIVESPTVTSPSTPDVPEISRPASLSPTCESPVEAKVARYSSLPPPMRPTTVLPEIVTTFHGPSIKTIMAECESPEGKIYRDTMWNALRPPHKPRNQVLVLAGLAFGAMTRTAFHNIQWLQRNYGPEPPVETGKVRVRWTCSCGEQLYDDFIERRPGAARELEAYLNRPRTHTSGGSSPASPARSNSQSSISGSPIGGPPSSQTSWSSIGQAKDGGIGGQEAKTMNQTSVLPPHMQYNPLAEPPWLLTCANEDKFTPKVAHLDMSPHKIKSDRDLAMALREHYFHLHRKWWKVLKLRGLTTIEFVQFECHQNR